MARTRHLSDIDSAIIDISAKEPTSTSNSLDAAWVFTLRNAVFPFVYGHRFYRILGRLCEGSRVFAVGCDCVSSLLFLGHCERTAAFSFCDDVLFFDGCIFRHSGLAAQRSPFLSM